MKKEEEVRVFLKDKSFSSEDTRTIRAIIKAKNYNGINVVNGGIPNSKLIDFIDWFEDEELNDNQNVITFRDKKYEFIESKLFNCCDNCDIRENIDIDNLYRCNLIPHICTSSKRYDKREGYFRLKEQELKLIPNEFYFATDKITHSAKWIIQLKSTNEKGIARLYFDLDIQNNKLCECDYVYTSEILRLATPEEKQQLINAVEKQENKLFNEKTKTFEDKLEDILVPKNIKIVCYDEDKKDLGILFNEDKQVLNFDFDCNIYLVNRNSDDFWTPIACKLIKTTLKELNKGDLFINRENIKVTELWDCSIYLGDNSHVFAYNKDIVTNYNINNVIYKITPID